MTLYEFEFGVYVDAATEADAWEKVRKVSEALDRIDSEGDSAVQGPTPVDDGALPIPPCDGGQVP